MRRKIAAGNWKMNKTLTEGQAFLNSISGESLPDGVELIIAPPHTHLAAMAQEAKGLSVAAQNCHWKESGAFTGEVSIGMLQDIGVNTVILGHSERREIFSESDEMIRQKVDACLETGMQVIWCCGEPLEVRQNENANAYIMGQLLSNLFHLAADEFSKLIIAYEPIWAIGTGETATPQQAQDMHKFIRLAVANHYNQSVADELPILYGGSVNPANAAELFRQSHVDGGLIGGASLKVDTFLEIARSFS